MRRVRGPTEPRPCEITDDSSILRTWSRSIRERSTGPVTAVRGDQPVDVRTDEKGLTGPARRIAPMTRPRRSIKTEFPWPGSRDDSAAKQHPYSRAYILRVAPKELVHPVVGRAGGRIGLALAL